MDKKTSNWEIKSAKRGLTFDDVLLIPVESHVLPSDVDMSVQLARNIKLSIPLIGANVDTATDSDMVITMTRQDGLGVVHKNMTIVWQADEVRKVKRSESGIVIDPFSLTPTNLVANAEESMNRYRISSVPITETVKNRKLIRIITNRDTHFATGYRIKIEEVMTEGHLVTAPTDTPLKGTEKILQEHKIEKLPIVGEADHLSDLITTKDIEKMIGFPNTAKGEYGRLLVVIAVSATSDTSERAEALLEADTDAVIVDIAHGHSAGIIRKIKETHGTFPEATLIADNVTTAEATKTLYDVDVDVVKVGVGPGSIYMTCIVASAGVPRLTAIYGAAPVTREYDRAIIADDGVECSGDIVKTLAAGGRAVILRNVLIGTDESPDGFEIYQGHHFETYHGVGSLGVMEKGSSDRCFQGSVDEANRLVLEGVEERVVYKGSVSDIVFQLISGLKSRMGCVGATDLEMLRKEVQFVQMGGNGLEKPHPHDIQITEEAPNCSVQ